MFRPFASQFVVGALILGQPALASELWQCEYIHYSTDKKPNAPPPLKLPSLYSVDGSEVRLLNGTSRYKIVSESDFGLIATGGDHCNICTGGPQIEADVLTINKVNGNSTIGTVLLSKAETDYWTDEGRCKKVSRKK